jgi:hypothetical protein
VSRLVSKILNYEILFFIDVRQIEVYTAEPLVPGPSSLEDNIAVTKLKKPPGT